MSFIARRNLTDSIKDCIKPEDLSSIEKKKSFYCPGCSCLYLYRSESSNEKAAHFFRHGKHDPGCWMPVAESIKGDVEGYETDDFSISDFYDTIVSAEKRVGKGSGTAGGGSPHKTKRHLSTIRYLYKFCCYHDNNHVINDDLRVKDIFVAEKTSYLYTTYVSNIHLIEARYWRYNPEKHTLFFYYPYSAKTVKEARFKVAVKCQYTIFSSLRDKVYSSDRIVLLLCDWTFSDGYAHGVISNTHQLVVL